MIEMHNIYPWSTVPAAAQAVPLSLQNLGPIVTQRIRVASRIGPWEPNQNPWDPHGIHIHYWKPLLIIRYTLRDMALLVHKYWLSKKTCPIFVPYYIQMEKPSWTYRSQWQYNLQRHFCYKVILSLKITVFEFPVFLYDLCYIEF